jgi:LytS/YehU family sensor histidine kinase
LPTELTARTREVERQSQQLEKQHIRQLELDFEQQLAEVQMGALRAQMNPYFIFNCLNSIQLYTTNNNAAKATNYLNRFSQLIRLVLENSRSERVTLGNELEALRLYLEMEAMRFKDKLRFTIKIDADLDTELIEIPPLLVQPYVENAIWHGLMHKPEGGRYN